MATRAEGLYAGVVSRPGRSRVLRRAVPYTFVLPKVVLFGGLILVPLVWSGILTFKTGSILGGQHYVGVSNYKQAVKDPEFRLALKNSVYYAALVIPITIGVGLGLAGLLNRPIRFRPLFIALLIVPSITSAVAASVIWDYLTLTDGGLFNSILGGFGIGPVNWLGTPSLIIPIFVALEVWRGMGFYTVLFLAAMQSIPKTLYDAGAIDGAVGFTAFRRITIPLMRPAILFAAVMATIWNLQLFDSPFVMTNGGPGFSSTTIVLYIYDQAFQYNNMGLAAAMAFVLFAIIMVLALVQLRVFRKNVEF